MLVKLSIGLKSFKFLFSNLLSARFHKGIFKKIYLRKKSLGGKLNYFLQIWKKKFKLLKNDYFTNAILSIKQN